RGHEVRIFAGAWRGQRPEGIGVEVLPARGWTNHGRAAAFARAAGRATAGGGFDAVVGFNRMPGLDVYYACDTCFVAQAQERHGRLYRMTPRYRTYARFERAVFAPQSRTQILLLAQSEGPVFRKFYGTPEDRFHPVPPVIAAERRRPPDADGQRQAMRTELGVPTDGLLVLIVGASFSTKGHDRGLRAVASLPPELRRRTRLMIVGPPSVGRAMRLARQLRIAELVQVLPPREDIGRCFLAADLLLHPARSECTGTVILEALIAGCPVLCTQTCGYSEHVESAQAGRVVPEPFAQATLDRLLAEMLLAPSRAEWSRNGIAYGESADLYRGHEVAAELVEGLAHRARMGRQRAADRNSI